MIVSVGDAVDIADVAASSSSSLFALAKTKCSMVVCSVDSFVFGAFSVCNNNHKKYKNVPKYIERKITADEDDDCCIYKRGRERDRV